MPQSMRDRRERSLRQCDTEYEQLKDRLSRLGYVLQGSVTERWNQCGKPGCRCKDDPNARHGPYYQVSWKEHGKTRSMYLDAGQVKLCRKFIANHKELERIHNEMRDLTLRVVELHKPR